MLTVGTLAFLVLTIFIVLFFFLYQKKMMLLQQQKQVRENQFQREMITSQLESLERERTRMASDLHDSIGSMLWGIKVNLTYLNRSMALDAEQTESFNEITEGIDQSIAAIRRIAWELTPEAFQHTGLSGSLRKLCEGLDGKGMKVVFSEDGQHVWNDDRALHVFRIVQELMTNAIKHAQAATMSVSLTWSTKQLLVKVEDNGIGFILLPEHGGVGWWNINQRVHQLKARIAIDSQLQGRGTHITLIIPLQNEQ